VEDVEPAVPLDLTFESGDALESGSIFVEWIDPFATDAEFAVLSPDDGNGRWSYTDVTNECTVGFYQGLITDLTVAGGDRRSTIDALAGISQANDPEITPELVEEYGVEFSLSQTQDDGVVSLWGLGAEMSDGSSWVNSARFFTAIERVQFVSVHCPTGVTAYQELERIIGPVGLQLRVVEAAD
jgi:hypothetical protein